MLDLKVVERLGCEPSGISRREFKSLLAPWESNVTKQISTKGDSCVEITQVTKDGRKRKVTLVLCDTCGCEFWKQTRFLSTTKNNYCTFECSAKGRQCRIEVQCAVCNKIIIRQLGKTGTKSGLQFCSQDCKNEAQTRETGLLKCFDGYWESASGYRAIALSHYPQKCEWCFEDALEMLDVHHIDHNRKNRNKDNLLVLCVWCHALETRKLVCVEERKPVPITNVGRTLVEKLIKRRMIIESIS